MAQWIKTPALEAAGPEFTFLTQKLGMARCAYNPRVGRVEVGV